MYFRYNRTNRNQHSKEANLDDKKAAIENACKELVKDLDDLLDWEWDDRFESLVAEFTTESQEQVVSILEKHLKLTWNDKSIKKAPGVIKANSERFGSLRKGQLMFTTDPESSKHIIAAWWPWGDGKSVSIRIATPD